MSNGQSEVERMFRSPLAAKTREFNQRLRAAVSEEDTPLCDCCNKPVDQCNCSGGCE